MRVTLLSNGHGEDVVGSLLARAFLALEPTLTVQAFPTVGTGAAYEALGIPILGPRRALPPTKGLGGGSSPAPKEQKRAR